LKYHTICVKMTPQGKLRVLKRVKGDKMSFIGDKIRALRIKAGLTQQQLAEKLGGISASTVGMYEQGRRTPDMAMIIRLGELFGVSTDSLLGVREESCETTEILAELKDRVTNSEVLTLNGAVMNAESREKLLKAIEFISNVVLEG